MPGTNLVRKFAAVIVAPAFRYRWGGAVTQITTSATGVAINTYCGQITTVALTTAAGAEERFTVTNVRADVADVIMVSTTYNGAGTPSFSVCNQTAGSFDIVITNLAAAAAFNAVMVLNFVIIKATFKTGK